MHFQTSIFVAALASLATASPIESRQLLGGTGITSKEFSTGGCKDVLFAWARGSTEVGNMVSHFTASPLPLHYNQVNTPLTTPQGTVVGPPTSNGLKKAFGADKVATEGIDYAAAIGTNAIPGGTDAISKRMMQETLTSMSQKCPDSIIVAGGYSQGAAVNHRAIESLDQKVKDQIAGVVLYGDTQKLQDRNQIPDFPADKVKIICQPGDAVCLGQLLVLPAHLTYGVRADEGVEFLVSQVKAKMGAKKANSTA